MERLFVDTSAWFAYVNRKDPEHDAVRRVLEEFPGRLLTSSYIELKVNAAMARAKSIRQASALLPSRSPISG